MYFGPNENKIIDMIREGTATIADIKEAYRQGADVNAIRKDVQDVDYVDGDPRYETIIYDMLLANGYLRKFKNEELIECVMDAGIDLNKYGSSIISDLVFFDYGEGFDLYEISKRILSSCTEKISLNVAKDRVETESSYLVVCNPFEDMSIALKDAGYLEGVYELLTAYERDEDYNNYYSFHRAIGQKVKSFHIDGDVCMSNKEEFRVKTDGDYLNMISVIELEDDQLVIECLTSAYIYNGKINKKGNSFSQEMSSLLEGQSIEAINFCPKIKKKDTNNNSVICEMEIIFSSGCRLLFYRQESEIYGVRYLAN